jgi:molybdopterin/thiamine biosynthesis adenylyltransferase
MRVRIYSGALPSAVHAEAMRHLIRTDGQEDLCFAIWYPSQGCVRTTALISQLILPRNGERRVHGNASFMPQYFERAVTEAARANGGLAFLHSHPTPGWQGMSDDDIRAEHGHAAAAKGATGLPLMGLTLGTDGAWSARFWEKVAPRTYVRRGCTHVRVVGDRFMLTYDDRLSPRPKTREEWRRTVSAWGENVQADLSRLHIGVVGVGSVGAIIAEALARTGIAHITLIDFDTIERLNLDRLLHATRLDAMLHRSKVACLGRALRSSATAKPFAVNEIDHSIVEDEGFRAALDCDILFSGVDRPWPRSVLNFLAYAHLIPVVDGGIAIQVTARQRLRRADWRAHVAAPDRPCLACLGQYDPGLVSSEREGYLDDPEYIQGLPQDHPLRRSENVFAFSASAASFQMLQMLMMVAAPAGVANAGAQLYHFVPGMLDQPRFCPCDRGCAYPSVIGLGDRAGFAVTGPHRRAEQVRGDRAKAQRSLPFRFRMAGLAQQAGDYLSRLLVQ